MELEELYRATLEKWGEKAQYEQLVEECAELIAALKHYERGKIERSALIAELADVTLMVGQLTWMLGEAEVREAIATKRTKLDALLSDPQGR